MTALQSALAPFTLKGFYLLTWGTTLGANVWNTLVSLTARREFTGSIVDQKGVEQERLQFRVTSRGSCGDHCHLSTIRHRARRLTVSVRLSRLQIPPPNHLWYPSIPAHSVVLFLYLSLLGRFIGYPLVLSPFPHLDSARPTALALFARRDPGIVDCRVLDPELGQLVVRRSQGDGYHV